ncbi:MAG: EamA family transporter RarD [Pseudomonadales bacterium]|jgi:chloramphenicol-sensitive protein RarD|nr:EamA family transporter RarD [Pseudomonadales bacterium]
MDEGQRGSGAAFAVAAYGFWGFAPLYFKWLGDIGAWQVVAHRVLWTALLLVPILLLLGALPKLRAVLGDRRCLAGLALSAVLIGGNWSIFIYAILAERVLEASLGYFVNPLVSLVLGMIFLGERLRPVQWLAVAVASAGVVNELLRFGDLPWLGLMLAFSFGFYGLVRKRLAVDSFVGLTVESWILLPPALAWLAWNFATGGDHFTRSLGDALRLTLAGPVTMIPLLCFAAAANRLPLSFLGFFQYIAPSLMFVLAVTRFGEPFEPGQTYTFGPIWCALLLFTANAVYVQRRAARARSPEEPA